MIGLWLFSAVLALVGLADVFFPAQVLGAFRMYDYWTERRYTLAFARVVGILFLVSAAVAAYTASTGR